MQAQLMKCVKNESENSNYCWLRRRKSTLSWMSAADEFRIRQALNKVGDSATT